MKVLRTLILFAALAEPLAAAQPAPEPAETSSRATHGLLLDVASTGERLVAVGERGDIVVSKDDQAWVQVGGPGRSTLTAVTFAGPRQGWAVGHDATIVHTSDGGSTWSLQNFRPDLHQPLLDVLFLDGQRGFAVGAFGLFLHTTDGGTTWQEVEAPAIREDGLHLNALARLANGSVLIAGEGGLLGVSIDGVTWERLQSPYEGTFFGALPEGEHGALVFGLRGNAWRIDDVRCGTWQKIELGTTASFFGGTTLGDGSSVLAGTDGLVLKVMADGRVKPLAHGASGTFSSVVAWRQKLVAVGETGARSMTGP